MSGNALNKILHFSVGFSRRHPMSISLISLSDMVSIDPMLSMTSTRCSPLSNVKYSVWFSALNTPVFLSLSSTNALQGEYVDTLPCTSCLLFCHS